VTALSLSERYVALVLKRLDRIEDERLHGLRGCLESVIAHGIPGDILVAGPEQGAGTVFLRALLAANRVTDRWLWIASPQGSWRDLDGVRGALDACNLLDDVVHFIEGPMWSAVPVTPVETLAMILLESGTGDAVEHLLRNLYPRLALGGYAIVDDYASSPECEAAVGRFRDAGGIAGHLLPLSRDCVSWRKERA